MGRQADRQTDRDRYTGGADVNVEADTRNRERQTVRQDKDSEQTGKQKRDEGGGGGAWGGRSRKGHVVAN